MSSDTGRRFGLPRDRSLVFALVVTIGFGCLLGLYSVLTPLYEAPDEPQHVDLVMHRAAGGDLPDYDDRLLGAAAQNDCATFASSIARCTNPGSPPTAPRQYFDRTRAPDRSGGPTFDELGGDTQIGKPNQLAQHPPLYYVLAGGLVQLERALLGHDIAMATEVAWLRLLSVAFIAPLPLIAWWTARRIGAGRRVRATAALLPLVIPQLTHIGSTVNNDNLLILLTSLVLAGCAGVVRGDDRWRTALAIGLGTGAALLTKSSALFLIPVIGTAYVAPRLLPWRDRARTLTAWRATVARLAGIAALVLVTAAWWYVRNKSRFGTFVPSIDDERINAGLQPPGFQPSPRAWSDKFLTFMVPRFWGWFGWYSAKIPLRMSLISSYVAGLLLAAGLWPRRRVVDGADGGPSWWQRTWLLVPGALVLTGIIVRAWGLYVRSGQTPFLQGRYLFPVVTVSAVLAGLGLCRLAGRWAPAVATAWVATMQIAGLTTLLHGYWGGPGVGPRGQLRAVAAWSRLEPALLVVIALGLVASGVAVTAVAVATGLRGDRPEPA